MDYAALGQKIREKRKEKNWKIRELADKVGISEDYMGKIERGDGVTSLETIVSVANALHVGVDTLIGNDLTVTEPIHADIKLILDKMDDTKRKRFLEFIRFTSDFFNNLND